MKTCLYDRHIALGAKIVSFADWEMPIQYKGVVTEHNTVRNSCGLFDVSHMGRILVEGHEAEKLLNELSTNQIAHHPDETATYTVWCHENGGSVDDLLIYRKNKNSFFIIVNASNREKDLQHLLVNSKGYDVQIRDRYQGEGILALQGPQAEALLSRFIPEVISIKPMHFLCLSDQGQELIISRTGYTGAGGFELYGSCELIVRLWDQFLERGKEYGIEPVGLGARDTLRLEKGYALYGHEMSDTIAPTESVAAWTVKLDKESFMGKSALEKLEKSPQKRHAYGIKLIDKGIPREGFSIYKDGLQIGKVTSGSFSPTLNQGIALILVSVSLQYAEMVEVEIRNQRCRAQVVRLPFL